MRYSEQCFPDLQNEQSKICYCSLVVDVVIVSVGNFQTSTCSSSGHETVVFNWPRGELNNFVNGYQQQKSLSSTCVLHLVVIQ